MYAIAGRLATGVATIIITDVLMEKYDVIAKVKDRYAQARTGITRLASQIRVSQGEDEGATSQEEAQETPLTLRERYRIWSAGKQYNLLLLAEEAALIKVRKHSDSWLTLRGMRFEARRNYIHTVTQSQWAGPEDEGELANV